MEGYFDFYDGILTLSLKKIIFFLEVMDAALVLNAILFLGDVFSGEGYILLIKLKRVHKNKTRREEHTDKTRV